MNHVMKLSEVIKKFYNIKKWGIKVDVVYYSNGKDQIRFPSDNDQVESKVVTVIVH